MHTKFDHYSFTLSGDMVGADQNLNCSRDLTTPLSGMICSAFSGFGRVPACDRQT